MGFLPYPRQLVSGETSQLPRAGRTPDVAPFEHNTTPFVLLAAARMREARLEQPPDDVSKEGPIRFAVEVMVAGIQAVQTGEAEIVSIAGPAGYAPLRLTAGNAGLALEQLQGMVGYEFPDILHPEVSLHHTHDIAINAGVPNI